MTTQPPHASLYRREALDAQGTRVLGTIVLAQPVPMRIAAWTATAITAALALLLTCGEYTRKAHVHGALVPAEGSVRVTTQQPGRIVRRLVRDHQRVAAGQVLFELAADRDVDADIHTQLVTRMRERAQAGQLQAEALRQNASALAQRQRSIEAELGARQRALAQQGHVIQAARDKVRRYRDLTKRGFAAPAQLADIEAGLADQLGRREELQSALLAVERDLIAVRDEAHGIDVKLRQIASQERGDVAGLRQEADEHTGRMRMRVTAPVAGTVSAITPDTGQSVATGAALATILPVGSVLHARLMVPPEARAFVRVGQPVRLRLASVPYQKFGPVLGTVEQVDDSPAATADAAVLYRVTVRLARQSATMYGQEVPFSDGTPLEADLLLDRRRLIAWLIDPLVSAAGGRAP